jgi:hypothetical protein
MDQPPRPRTERLVNKKMIAYSYLELGVIAALVCTVKCFPFVTPPPLFFFFGARNDRSRRPDTSATSLRLTSWVTTSLRSKGPALSGTTPTCYFTERYCLRP